MDKAVVVASSRPRTMVSNAVHSAMATSSKLFHTSSSPLPGLPKANPPFRSGLVIPVAVRLLLPCAASSSRLVVVVVVKKCSSA